ncbi:MAG: hypothetical protein OXH15_06060 [Gammaproteobacteria bacterium]|nr:hypothetical protein [Gammaproteobacteria bacterium]
MAQLDWLPGAQAALNDDPAFRKLGSTDLVLGLKSGRAVRRVVFEAFEIASVDETDEAVLRDCEIVIEMTPREWTNYLRRRAKGTGPTLMSLDLDRDIVRAANPLDQLKFDRYHLSLQALVDQGAQLAV